MGLYDLLQAQPNQNIQMDIDKYSVGFQPSFGVSNTKIKRPDSKKKYGEGKEAAMIRDEMGNFDPMTSDAMRLIKAYYGNSLRLSELKGIINAIREYLFQKDIFLPKLSRNANRNYQLCIKYIQDHFEVMRDIFPFVRLHDNLGNIIPVHEF